VRKNILAIVFLGFCTLLVAQQALNNDAVIKLVKAGLSERSDCHHHQRAGRGV